VSDTHVAPASAGEKDDRRPHVVILGGGFGGLYAARALRNVPVRITLADQHNYHLFQPLLYQVATAALNPSDIANPIRSILRRQKNVLVILGEATSIDAARKRVQLLDEEIAYDYLVLATGVTHSYFAHPEWAGHAPGLKSIDDALEIRRRVLLAFEAAERERDPEKQKIWLTFVVVGAGPTGVELAGALSEIARETMIRDFRRINPASARVILIEGKDRVLPPYPPDLSQKAARQLERIGVEIMTNAMVTDLARDHISIGERTIKTRTVLWAAGVQASPLAKTLGAPLDRAGRVEVQPDLTVPGHPEIFVVGDLAAVKQPDGTIVPGVAQGAIQGGNHAALNIERAVGGQPLRPFHYHDRGSMATIGRAAAVADLGFMKLSGLVAWLAWIFIHIFFLVGFRNRFMVVSEWAWAYLMHVRGARLITGKVEPLLRE
jgi:NADH dehydrogenase